MKKDQIDRIIFEGPLALWQLGILGLAIALILGLLFWRDWKLATRRALVPLLFFLRLTALAGVLIALAAPTQLTEISSIRKQALAIYLDDSSSMTLIDEPDGSGNSIRWNDFAETKSVKRMDAWAASLNSIRTQLHQSLTTQHSSDNLELFTSMLVDAKKLSREIEEEGHELSKITDYLEDELTPALAKLISLSRDPNNSTITRDETRVLVSQLVPHARELQKRSHQLAAQLETQLIATEKLPEDTARIHQATAWLDQAEESWLQNFQKHTAIQRFTFSKDITHLGTDSWSAVSRPHADSTDLNTTLQNIAQDSASGDLRAAVLITDGQQASEDGSPLEIPGGLDSAPLFIVPIGGTQLKRDIILHHILAPRYTLHTDIIPIETMITAISYEGESTKVQLLLEDEVIEERVITFESAVADQRVNFSWKPEQVGSYSISVRVIPLAEESREENNQASVQVDAIDDKLRILIADSRPRWETRYLLNLFERTERIAHSSILFSPTTAGASPPTLPYSLKTWQNFGIVVLGDLNPDQLTLEHQNIIKDYLSSGGKIIVISGQASMPASFQDQPFLDLLPVQSSSLRKDPSQGARLSLSADGKRSKMLQLQNDPHENNSLWQHFFRKLPAYDLSPYSIPKPSATVLIDASMRAENSRRAYLSWHQYGKGAVVYLASPSTFHLRYLQGDTYHYRFWGQLLQWISSPDLAAGTAQLRISSDKTSYQQGEPIRATLSLADHNALPISGSSCRAALISNDETHMEVTCREDPRIPGQYHAIFENPPTGNFEIIPTGSDIEPLLQDTSVSTPVVVLKTQNRELDPGLCNFSALQSIAAASKGMIISPSALPAALKQFTQNPKKIVHTSYQPLWNQWTLLLLIISALSLEWIGRRAAGII